MEGSNELLADATRLRDELRAIADTYSRLCIYLREVHNLAELVVSDYHQLRKSPKELGQRLSDWRSLERTILNAIRQHSSTDFTAYEHYEAAFMKRLHESAGNLAAKRESTVQLKSRRFKEGVIALKYATDARTRSHNIAQFILAIKKATKRDPGDYLDNLIILQSLVNWTKDVINDCVRCTSSSSDKYTSEKSNGQLVYTNEVLRRVLEFVDGNTTVTVRAKGSNLHRSISYILENMTFEKQPIPPSVGLGASHISYYLFNLLEDLQSNCRPDAVKLQPVVKAISDMKVPAHVETPYHPYRVHDYFRSMPQSKELLKLIHEMQQGVISSVSLSLASDIFRQIKRVTAHKVPDDQDLRAILVALRAAKYLTAPKRRLLGIWDKAPFIYSGDS